MAFYGLITVATSYSPNQYGYETHSYMVSTNCSNATSTTGQISVTEGRIVSPSQTSFITFGIPSETLNMGEEISGELAPALTRNCEHSLDTSTINVVISVYTCKDNGITSCIVNFTHLD